MLKEKHFQVFIVKNVQQTNTRGLLLNQYGSAKLALIQAWPIDKYKTSGFVLASLQIGFKQEILVYLVQQEMNLLKAIHLRLQDK